MFLGQKCGLFGVYGLPAVASFRQGMFFEAACFNGVECCVLACPTSGHGTRASRALGVVRKV